MFYLSLIIVIAILIIGSVKMWDFYLEDESLKLLLTFIGTIIIATITTIFFVYIGWIPNAPLSIKNINNPPSPAQTVIDESKTETFSAKKVYRDGDNAIIEDEGGYKVIVDLYSWKTEVYYKGEKEDEVKVRGLYWYTSNLNNIKNKDKFVKTKIFKSKDGSLRKIEIILENNRHTKDFGVSY